MIFAFLGGLGLGLTLACIVTLTIFYNIGRKIIEGTNKVEEPAEQPTKPVFDEYQDNN